MHRFFELLETVLNDAEGSRSGYPTTVSQHQQLASHYNVTVTYGAKKMSISRARLALSRISSSVVETLNPLARYVKDQYDYLQYDVFTAMDMWTPCSLTGSYKRPRVEVISTPKMKAIYYSETSLTIYKPIRRHNADRCPIWLQSARYFRKCYLLCLDATSGDI
jgi:hypothetical protein